MNHKKVVFVCIAAIFIACFTAGVIISRERNDYNEEGQRSEDYDAVLNNIGTPKETIDSMSYEFKEYICNTIGKDEKFEFHNPEIYLDYDNEMAGKGYGVTIFTTSFTKENVDINRIYLFFSWFRPPALFSGGESFWMNLYTGWMIKIDEDPPSFQLRQGKCGVENACTVFYETSWSGSVGAAFHIPFTFDWKALFLKGDYRGYMDFCVKENISSEREGDKEKYFEIGCSFNENMRSQNVPWGCKTEK